MSAHELLEDPFDDEDDGEEEGAVYETCQCVNVRLCARHLIGLCDGHRYEVGAREDGESRDELNGRMRFPTRYDREWFDE